MELHNNKIDEALLLEQTGWLQSLARGLVSNAHHAEEIAQETLLTALNQPPRETEGPALRAWLARVARNLAFTSVRSQKNRTARERVAAPSERLPSVHEAVERTELRQYLVDAILQLDSPYREVVILRYLEHMSTEQVAHRTGASLQAVRTRLSRGLGMLRASLDEEYGGDRHAWMAVALPLAQKSSSIAASVASASNAWFIVKLSGSIAGSLLLAFLGWRSLQASPVGDTAGSALLPKSVELNDTGVIAGPIKDAWKSQPEALSPEPAITSKPKRVALPAAAPKLEVRLVVKPNEANYAKSQTFTHGAEEVRLTPAQLFPIEFAQESQDHFGYPAVSVSIAPEAQGSLMAWTDSHKGKMMAIVVRGDVLTMARIMGALRGPILITGGAKGFTEERVTEILIGLGFPPRAFEPYTFHGELVDAQTGNPIGNATFPDQDKAQPELNRNGLLKVHVKSASIRSLGVGAPGYATATIVFSNKHNDPASAQIIDLVKSGTLHLRVLDAAGTPIPDAVLGVTSYSNSNKLRPRWLPSTGSGGFSGDFERTDLSASETGEAHLEEQTPQTPLLVRVFASTAERTRNTSPLIERVVVLNPGETRSIELKLQAPRSVHGIVLGLDGAPLEGATVAIIEQYEPWRVLQGSGGPRSSRNAGVITTSAGRFTLDNVPEEGWRLGALFREKGNEGTRRILIGISTPQARTKSGISKDVELRLELAECIAGVVVDAQDKPVNQQVVCLWSELAVLPLEAITDARGSFTFPIIPPGSYWLTTQFVEVTSPSSTAVVAGSKDLVLRHTPGRIRLEVLAREHPRDLGIAAHLYAAEPNASGTSTFQPTGVRSLACVSVPPGNYNAVARTRDGRVGLVTGLEVGDDQTELTVHAKLGPGIPLVVELVGSSPPRLYRILWEHNLIGTGRLNAGLSDWQLVPPGVLQVQLFNMHNKVLATRTIEAIVGRTARVTFGK